MRCYTPPMHDDSAPPTLSTREVAARLGCDVSTVRRRRKRGELVAHEVANGDGTFAWRFPAHLLPDPAPQAAPPAEQATAPVGAPPAAVATVAPPGRVAAPDVRALVERAAAAEALASYLLMRVRELEAMHAPPARTPWWRRLLRRG